MSGHVSSEELHSIPIRRQALHVGTAGWTIPRESSSNFSAEGTHLQRYSRIFQCAEINSTFYRPHRRQTWQRWKAFVPNYFLFSVKAPRAITHEAKLNCSAEQLAAFIEQIGILDNNLGPILFQLPPSLQFEEASAGKFLSMIRNLYEGDIVWEPRHASWFQGSAEDLLRGLRVARVAADPACVPAASHPGGWDGLCYYRLHGSPRRYYSSYESEFLGAIVSDAVKSTARDVWCIFDNTASGSAMKNALEMNSLWSGQE